ncbi:MAG: helix-turn-helix transcriptional regulator [Bacilli bacterium]|jgi:transcriptional regulator with XRE-family HTH domain
MDYGKVGSLIATLRKEKGLTQKELADKLGITDRAVSKWERGLGCPDVSLLDDLSRILDVSILEILKGRRLDKDEIVNNKSIIESMNYSKESFKYKLKRIFNLAAIITITFISIMLVIFNLKSIYYMNKTYHNNIYDEENIYVFNDIEKNISLIKNNKGIYSDNDYNKILMFVKYLETNLAPQDGLYYSSKINYSYNDIAEFYKLHHNYIYSDLPINSGKELYEMLHDYNPDVIDNIIIYSNYTRMLANYKMYLFEQLTYPYYNDKKISNAIVLTISGSIYTAYYRDNMLLKDIIEVGEINE